MRKIKVETKEINGETWFKFNSKFDKIRYYKSNLITGILIIVLIALGLTIVLTVWRNIEELKANPFVYGASKMGNVDCQCSQTFDSGKATFFFNDTNFWVLKENFKEIEINTPDGDWDQFTP